MKRGRPSKRTNIRRAILTTLENSRTPLTTSSLGRLIDEGLNTRTSWNTIQKYVRELVETNRVEVIALPHSKKKGETGLIMYTLKK